MTLDDTILYRIRSFIPDIYIAPLQETYSEALSVQQRSRRNVLRSLQKEDSFFQGSKRSVRGSSFQEEGPIKEKARRWTEEPRAHHEPKNEGLGGKLSPKLAYRDQ